MPNTSLSKVFPATLRNYLGLMRLDIRDAAQAMGINYSRLRNAMRDRTPWTLPEEAWASFVGTEAPRLPSAHLRTEAHARLDDPDHPKRYDPLTVPLPEGQDWPNPGVLIDCGLLVTDCIEHMGVSPAIWYKLVRGEPLAAGIVRGFATRDILLIRLYLAALPDINRRFQVRRRIVECLALAGALPPALAVKERT